MPSIVTGPSTGQASPFVTQAEFAAYLPIDATNLPNGTIIAHRGGANVYPEETMEAFRLCAQRGLPLEFDLQRTKDGALAVCHDDTADRTTTLTGNVSDLTADQWMLGTVDAGSWHATPWGNLKPVFFDDVLKAFAGKVVLMPEVKNATDAQDVVDAVVNASVERSVIIQSTDQSALSTAITAGIEVMLVAGSGTGYTPATIKAAGINYVALGYTGAGGSAASAATIASYIAAGVKVAVYTLSKHYERDYYLSTLGVWAVMSDDPIYFMSPADYRSLTDPYASQSYYHGQSHALTGGRGSFTAPDYLTIPTYAWSGEAHIAQGWACPIANAASTYSITFTMKVDSVSDTSRHGGLVVCSSTDVYPKSAASSPYPGGDGYHILIRATGAMEIYKVTNGSAALSGGPTSTASITAGNSGTFRVDVTPTQVSVTRTDVGPTALTVTDSTYRGGYFFASKAAATTLGVSYKDVTIA